MNIAKENVCGIIALKDRIKRDYGFSLLEVLIALILLTFGVVLLTKIQYFTFLTNQDAYLRSIAIFQLDALRDRLRANPNHFDAEVTRWNADNAALLPKGKGFIEGSNPYQITVYWLSSRAKKQESLSLRILI